jgi:hypothetical protein
MFSSTHTHIRRSCDLPTFLAAACMAYASLISCSMCAVHMCAPVLQAGDTLSRNTYRNGSLLRDIEAADARGMYTSFCG